VTARLYAYLIAAALLLGGLYALKFLYDRNLELRNENSMLTMQRDMAQAASKRMDELMLEKIQADARRDEELARLRRSFRQEKNDDPVVAEWAGVPLPGGVLRVLRDDGRPADAAERDGTDGADARP